MSLEPVHIGAARAGLPAARDALHGSPGLTALRRAIADVDTQRQDLVDAGDLHNLAHGLAQLAAILGDLRQLKDAVEADVASLMEAKKVEVPGLGVIERRKATTRKAWDWPSLLPALVRGDLDPDGTGELPAAGEVVDTLVTLIQEVILGGGTSKAPLVGGLKARGFDPDEWAECSPGRTTVQIHADVKGD